MTMTETGYIRDSDGKLVFLEAETERIATVQQPEAGEIHVTYGGEEETAGVNENDGTIIINPPEIQTYLTIQVIPNGENGEIISGEAFTFIVKAWASEPDAEGDRYGRRPDYGPNTTYNNQCTISSPNCNLSPTTIASGDWTNGEASIQLTATRVGDEYTPYVYVTDDTGEAEGAHVRLHFQQPVLLSADYWVYDDIDESVDGYDQTSWQELGRRIVEPAECTIQDYRHGAYDIESTLWMYKAWGPDSDASVIRRGVLFDLTSYNNHSMWLRISLYQDANAFIRDSSNNDTHIESWTGIRFVYMAFAEMPSVITRTMMRQAQAFHRVPLLTLRWYRANDGGFWKYLPVSSAYYKYLYIGAVIEHDASGFLPFPFDANLKYNPYITPGLEYVSLRLVPD